MPKEDSNQNRNLKIYLRKVMEHNSYIPDVTEEIQNRSRAWQHQSYTSFKLSIQEFISPYISLKPQLYIMFGFKLI